MPTDTGGGGATQQQHSKDGRVIVRNLSYRAMKPDLVKAMSRFGKIEEVVLGEKPSNKPSWPFPHGGFAFVQFPSRKDAEKVVAASTSSQGLKVRGRQVAVDLSVDTRTFAKKKREKRQREKEEEKEEEEQVKEEIDEVEEEQSEGEDGGSDEDEEDSGDESPKAKRQCGFDLAEGKTLFIRNLPFNCGIPDVVTELAEQLKADGEEVKQPVVFVKFVGGGEHPSSGKAFVKMRSRELADRLLEIEEKANRVLGLAAKEEKSMSSAAATANLEGVGIHVGGRRVVVNRAMKPDEVAKAAEKKSNADSKKNLHLLKEGYIDPESEEFLKLTASEKRLREASWKERKYKMYNNTNFILNPLRLSIRNLAVHTTKQSLKHAIDEALKEANVKASTRHSVKVTVLVDEERRVPIPGDDTGATTKRCKGYAFADFRNNQVALKCLRMMNNNNKYLDSDRRPIVEFAIEDKRALRQLEHSKQKQMEKKKEITEVHKDVEKSHKGGRGARQRAARRKRAEELVAADGEATEKVDKTAEGTDETAAGGDSSIRKKLSPGARRRARKMEQKEQEKKEKPTEFAEDRQELERLAQAVAKSRQENADATEFPSRVRKRAGRKREADKLLETEQKYLSKIRRMQEE